MTEQDSENIPSTLRESGFNTHPQIKVLKWMSFEVFPNSFCEFSDICDGDYYRSIAARRQVIPESLDSIYEGGSNEISFEILDDLSKYSIFDWKGTSSLRTGFTDAVINFTQYIEPIIPASGGTQVNNGNNSSVTPASPSVTINNNIRTIYGTLQADTFTLESGFAKTIISGNGNVDFGEGPRDVIDLTNISSTTVSFNYANTPGGGVVYDAGKGISLFDVITLEDGSQIYFQGVDAIKFADTTIDLSIVPNDPLFGEQWNLHMMGVHNAWRFTTGTNEIVIGVEDTGLAVDANGNVHPDVRNSILDANNYVAEPSYLSHGTSAQSIISAYSNNGLGISGINWESPTYQVDVVGGDGGDLSLANATQQLINQAQGKPLIINLSLTGGDSIEQLVANNPDNVLFVIAAGNDNQDSLATPANLAQDYDNVIAVGAVWGDRDWFANPKTPGERTSYAGGWGSNYGDGLTGVAGSEVPAAAANANQSGGIDFGYHYYSDDPNINPFFGTSAATPQVSGIASLVWSANPGLKAGEVKNILSSTAYDLGAPGYDTEYGFGVFNADAAVRSALATSRI